jgi:hypothetical protein
MYGDMANGKDFASERLGDGGNGGGERWPNNAVSVISGFRREADENCALLRYYAVNSGKFLTYVSEQPIRHTFKGQGKVLTLEGGTDMMSRNVGNKFTTTHRVITKRSAFLF